MSGARDWRACVAVLALATGAVACDPPPPPGAVDATSVWTDPSPHKVTFVDVSPTVRLELLDWGGSGPPLIFLAGLGDVAHNFDDFAPQFTDKFHVFAITRRGYGASAQTPIGYDLASRVADLHGVIETLHLDRVTLVGHQIAGDELTGFAVKYPDRVTRLVYLDAAIDHSGLGALYAAGAPWPPPVAADSASPAALRAYLLRVYGAGVPEASLRATEIFALNGKLLRNVTPDSVDARMLAECGHPDHAHLRAPALAIYAVTDSAPQAFPLWATMDSASRARGRAYIGRLEGWEKKERAAFRRSVPRATVVEVHGANHYVFFSNQAETVRAMRGFLGEPAVGKP